jgi:hypothetical protein
MAKKMKTEMEQGVQFIKTILKELDPSGINCPPPIEQPVCLMNPPIAPIAPPRPIMPPNPIMPITAAAAPLDASLSSSLGDT